MQATAVAGVDAVPSGRLEDRGTTVRDALKSYLALAGGVTEVTRQRALEAAKALVSQGEAAAEQVTSLAEDLLSQTRQNREAVVALVGFEVDRALGRVGLATADEVTELTNRVRQLEAQLADASRSTPRVEAVPSAGSSSSPTPGKRGQTSAPAAKKAPAATKAPAAKKAPAKRSTPSGTSAAAGPAGDPPSPA